MRVAMITNYPVTQDVVPGGVTAVAHYLVKGLARLDDLEIHVICCQEDVEREETVERDGAVIHFLPSHPSFQLLTNWAPHRRLIRAVAERIRPDVIHGQGLGLPVAAALDLGLPWGLTIHGVTWRESGFDAPSLRARLRWQLHARHALWQVGRIRNLFVISGYAAQQLPPGWKGRQFIINNPVGDPIFEIRNAPRSPHILMVGGLRQRKDPLTGMKVMERVLRDVPDATLHLLGPDSGTGYPQQVADHVRARGLEDRVKLLGLVPDEVLKQEYERASLLLMTSLEETAPVAIGEACAVGIPVVGTDGGGIPWMVEDGVNGFVRPVRDVDALAERVTAVLKDAELRDRLARGARRIGREEFALDAIARKTRDAYAEIIREHRD